MNVQEIAQLISTLGFPIVVCCLSFWYIKYTHDKNREDIEKMQATYEKEMVDITQALNNNTIALTKLCERLEEDCLK